MCVLCVMYFRTVHTAYQQSFIVMVCHLKMLQYNGDNLPLTHNKCNIMCSPLAFDTFKHDCCWWCSRCCLSKSHRIKVKWIKSEIGHLTAQSAYFHRDLQAVSIFLFFIHFYHQRILWQRPMVVGRQWIDAVCCGNNHFCNTQTTRRPLRAWIKMHV